MATPYLEVSSLRLHSQIRLAYICLRFELRAGRGSASVSFELRSTASVHAYHRVFPSYNARPLKSPAAVADDRQLHRLKRVTTLQLPRKDLVWNPDPSTRTPILLF